MTNLTALPIPTLDIEEQQARNILYSRAPLPIQLQGKDYALSFTPPYLESPSAHCISLSLGNTRVGLCLSQLPDSSAIHQSAGCEPHLLPPDILAAVLDVVWAEELEALSTWWGNPCSIQPWDDRCGNENLLVTGLHLHGNPTVHISLHADATTLRQLATRLGNQPLLSVPRPHLPLTGLVYTPLHPLRPDQLDGLERGDVLMVPTHATTVLAIGGLQFTVTQQASEITVEKIMHTTDAQEATSSLTLTVPLQVQAGTLTLTLEQLSSLQPGMALTFDDNNQLLVTSGSTHIGRGELVMVGQHRGIRLLEVFDHDHA